LLDGPDGETQRIARRATAGALARIPATNRDGWQREADSLPDLRGMSSPVSVGEQLGDRGGGEHADRPSFDLLDGGRGDALFDLEIYQRAETLLQQAQQQLLDTLTPLLESLLEALFESAAGSIDIAKLKRKSVSLHWELMFTRSSYETPDMIEQHRLLTEVARLVDAGKLRSTRGEHFGVINAANLKRAHALLESGKAMGKIVLEGF
jgi:Zinc-binding dehydrogenase